MSSKKSGFPPYSERHKRRLNDARKASVFQKVNRRFQESFSVREDTVENIEVEENCVPSVSKQENSNLLTTAVLNSIAHSYSPIDSTDKIATKQCAEGTHTVKVLQHPDTSRQFENVENVQERRVEDQLKWKDWFEYLQDVNDLDESDSYSDLESEYDDAEDNQLQNLKEEQNNDEFVKDIRMWSIDNIHTIPHSVINSLLQILTKHTGVPFPKNARTLLKTPRLTEVFEMGDKGQYCHYGLTSAVLTFIAAIEQKNIQVDHLDLLVNIDGAPLAQSSEKGLWIISCSESILKDVEVVGLYHGQDKPSDPNELLRRFVEELKYLISNGVDSKGKTYKIKLQCLVCDAPAKAYVLNVKYHTGYWSCTKCTIKGSWKGKVYFAGGILRLRTDEGFKEYLYIDDGLNDGYQQGRTILNDIPGFGLVTNVILDYMHLICLGVMLKLIELWISGPISVRLSEQERQKVSDRLENLKDFMPSDFSRKPRQFKNVRRLWKAHELRQFLLYSGPVVLLGIVKDNVYKNFMRLHVAIKILINPVLCRNSEYLNFADEQLTEFVIGFTQIYDESNVTFNVHNLLHVVQDVKNFGPLDSYSAFRFENHIRKVKRLVRKGEKPLQQIARRLAEMQSTSTEYSACGNNDNFVLEKGHSDGPLLSFDPGMSQFRILRKNLLHINCHDPRNNCVLLKEGNYIECLNFIQNSDNIKYVVGKEFKIVKSFYVDPIDSQNLNISVVEHSNVLKLYLCESIIAKVCKIPQKNFYVLFPMMHTYSHEH